MLFCSIDLSFYFFLHDPPTPEISTDVHPLSLLDALPISTTAPSSREGASPNSTTATRPPSPRATSSCRTAPATPGATAPPHPQSCSSFSSVRSEEHTSELQSLMRLSYAVFCLKKKKNITQLTR